MKLRGWTKKYQSLPLNRKIRFLLVVGILLVFCTGMTVSVAALVSNITDYTKGLARINVESMVDGTNVIIRNYETAMKSLIMDEAVQGYLKETGDEKNKEEFVEESYKSLLQIYALRENVNFIALVKNNTEYLYRGKSIDKSGFVNGYSEDLGKSILYGNGDFKFSYSDAYFQGEQRTLTFYQPIYDMDTIGKCIGILCLNVDEKVLDMLNTKQIGNSTLKVYLVDKNGKVKYSDEDKNIGSKICDSFKQSKGDFNIRNSHYIYQCIDTEDLYIVGVIDTYSIPFLENIIILLLGIANVFVIILILILVTWGIKKTYEPIRQLVAYMDQVSEGDLSVRIDENQYGEDFYYISHGFNHMLHNIDELMKQVRKEQEQNTQIQLNVLQAYINPHFLYNALDCIHWQAAAAKNQEVSQHIKALADFYRISLSRGRDRISLGEELECIRNYLLLQNMRFGHIVDFKCQIEEKDFDREILKMSLQPLVENAIYHGIKKQKKIKGLLYISLAHKENVIVISVSDNGKGMTDREIESINQAIEKSDEKFGYGVRNVNRRLQLCYGKEYGLHYQKNGLGGITVEVRLPDRKVKV